MGAETRNVNIANDITFLDVNGNALTQSQAFQGFTNYFVTSSKLLKYVSKPTEVVAGRKSLNYIYESLKRPEMLEDHLLGEEVHNKARKGKRTIETIVKVNQKFSTLPDEFDGLIDQYRGNGKFTITDTAMKSHAQEVAKKIDKMILDAHMAMKRTSGNYANVTTIDVADKEAITKAEADKLIIKLLRKAQIIKNRETAQNVGREEALPVAMINPVIYTALAQSDFYRAYNPTLSEGAARTGRISNDQFGGIDIVEISQFDPINKERYSAYTNAGIVLSIDNVGGDAITEPAQSKVAGASTVQTFNIRGIAGFGTIRNEEDQRIEFIELTVSGASNPESAIDVTSKDGKVVKLTTYMKNGTTPKVKIVKEDGTAAGGGDAQDITTTSAEYTFTLTAAGSYKAITTTGTNTQVAESDLILIEEE